MLDMVVAHQLKDSTLPEDSSFIIDGPVPKVEEQPRAHPIAVSNSHLISHGYDLALGRLQQQKAVT